MAKDKSKKSSKSIDDSEFGKPSEAPSGGDGWKLASDDTRGKLMLITPLRKEEVPAFGKAGAQGEKTEIIVADVVVLNKKKPEKSEEHEEVYVFQKYVQGALRGFIGTKRVLGRLQYTEDTSKATSASGGYYWELEDANSEDQEVALAYLKSLDPFAQKGAREPEPEAKRGKGKKSKPEPEPEPEAKKGKGKKKK